MTVHADITTRGSERADDAGALDIRDTPWGFVVTETARHAGPDHLSELVLKFAAACLAVAALAQWLLPGSLFSGEVVLMKLALTLVLGGAAASVFRFADRGFRAELQVDAVLREIRVGSRNVRGIARISHRFAMRSIEECFLRPADRPGLTEVCFRVTGHAEPVQIAAGAVTDIAPILERLTRDLRTPRERVELRMAG
jgi:hypothetical protein